MTQEQVFKEYGDIITALITESVSCSPSSWNKGTLTIDCDGTAINYKLKNEDEEEKATISGPLRDLCERLYVVMRNNNEAWIQAVLHFSNNEDSWLIDANFNYETDNKKVAFETKHLSTEESELAKIVRSYIRDYEEWNKFAVDNSDFSGNSNDDVIYEKYKELIDKYCVPDKKFQGLSWGGSSYKEEIVSVIEAGNVGLVKTKRTDTDYTSEYEYHFVKSGQSWKLEEVYYIDCFNGKKYESL